jgi:hypothetical protein
MLEGIKPIHFECPRYFGSQKVGMGVEAEVKVVDDVSNQGVTIASEILTRGNGSSALIEVSVYNFNEEARTVDVDVRGGVDFGGKCKFSRRDGGRVEMSGGGSKLQLETRECASGTWFEPKTALKSNLFGDVGKKAAKGDACRSHSGARW